MRGSASARAALAATLLALATPKADAQEATWALTNARIETVTRGVIETGTIVIRSGLIAAVGASAPVPPEARVLDLSGRTVYPGLFDLTSTLGLPSAAQRQQGGGAAAGGPPAAQAAQTGNVGLEPERMIAGELRPSASDIRAARDAGITAVLVAPSRGAFRGQSALVPLRDSVAPGEYIRTPVALHMGFEGRQGFRVHPATLLGVIAYERQSLYDAQRQALLLERYRASPRGMARPSSDPALNALVPVVSGALPVFFAADNEREIRRAVSIGSEFGLRLTVVGATEGFRAVDALRASGRPAVVTVDYPRPTEVTGWQYAGAQRRPLNDSTVADSLVRGMLEANAAALHRAGIRFALASGGLNASTFIGNVRKAIAAGLPREEALAALTIRAAEVAGVEPQLGSIEEGKIANLVVADGDLLGDSARVRMVFVDGIRYAVEPPAGGGRGGGGGGGGGGGRRGATGEVAAAVEVGGTWDLTVESPQGEQAVTMMVAQSGGSGFSGTMTSPMGTIDIEGGTIEGRRLSWSITLDMGGQHMTMAFSGEVDGTRISGTAQLGEFGSAAFRGEKRP